MYDQPLSISYQVGGLHDFGAGALATSIIGPPGATGVLRAIHAEATETFTDTTTSALFRIGSTGDADLYLEMDLLVLAATDSMPAPETAFKLRTLPADTQLEVTGVAPTGGTPAGIARMTVVIDWNLGNKIPDPTP